MTAVIQAEGLGKRYQRGVTWEPGLRHTLDKLAWLPQSVARRERRWKERGCGKSMQDQVFERFPCWQGPVPEGFVVDFLGVLTRAAYYEPYLKVSQGYPADRYVRTEYPPISEDYFEWADVLESVLVARDHFTMIELGAGWGRWVTKAAVALRSIGGLPSTCIAVEAEPSHFRFITEHLGDNGLDSKRFRLIEAAVARADGKIGFQVGTNLWEGTFDLYSQAIGGPQLVEAVSLRTLLAPLVSVDLIDLDVQGAELEVLEGAADELDQKVKRVHIGTHSRRVEEGLRSLFGRLGWKCRYDFPGSSTVEIQGKTTHFQDGIQTWLNPSFLASPANDVAVLQDKLRAARGEGARLWAELEKVRETLDRERLSRDSVAWRLMEKSRRLRDRVAPSGTHRRKLLEFVSKKIRG
jgi:FkbM family methyltransferase